MKLHRNQVIAIGAGTITVIAIVVAFAAEYLDLPWKWLRPAAELLLLAELVGLIVLERHQLFEPVHQTVGGMNTLVHEMHAMMTEAARSSGQVSVCASTPEVFATGIRILREAIARDQSAPQVLRSARLSGRLRAEEDPDLLTEYSAMVAAVSAFYVTPSIPSDARSRHWWLRVIFNVVSVSDFDDLLEQFLRRQLLEKTSNAEAKILTRPKIEGTLAPLFITDRDVLLTFDDAASAFRWGVRFQGLQYRTLVERWFDDLWASIPDSYLVHSRRGFEEGTIERIREELKAAETERDRRIVKVNG